MQQIVDFILELDKLKGVTRKTRPLGLDRYENSAEHSWQIALLAASLAQFAETGDRHRSRDRACCWCTTSARSTPATPSSTPKRAGRAQGGRARGGRRGFSGCCRSRKARGSWRCGRSSRTGKRPKRASPTPPTGRCRCCSISPTRARAGGRTASRYERVVRRVGPPIKAGCPALWTWLAPQLEDARGRGFFGG